MQADQWLGMRMWCRAASTVVAICVTLASAAHAAGTTFSTMLSGTGQDYATAVTTDTRGNTYVAGLTYSSNFQVTASAYQTAFGGTCDAFVAKLDPSGKVVWATYLGGILDDWATGIALDAAGNVWVTGDTRSPNFPVVNPIVNAYNEGATDDFDAFVAKFDPSGGKLLYSTYLGGNLDDDAAGLALDAAGNVYVAVSTNSTAGYPGYSAESGASSVQYGILVTKLTPQGALVSSYFHPVGSAAAIALDTQGDIYVAGNSSLGVSSATKRFGALRTSAAFVFKISADGSRKFFETALSGSAQTTLQALAVNAAGEVWLAGNTTSVDFPLAHPLQSSTGSRPLWKSTDGGMTWAPIDDLPFAQPQTLIVDRTNPATLYIGTKDLGLFQSSDGGSTWTRVSSIACANVATLAIDPVHAATLYAACAGSGNTVYKSVDGAVTWTVIDSPPEAVGQLLIDGQNPQIIYEVFGSIRKSTDGGATWNGLPFPGPAAAPGGVQMAAIDPQASGHLFAESGFYFCGFFCSNNMSPAGYRSVDAGQSWSQLAPFNADARLLVDTSTNPSTVYDGLSMISVDGGATWTTLPVTQVSSSGGQVTVDANGTLYAPVFAVGNFVSRDHAQTWTQIGSFIPPWSATVSGPAIASIIPAGTAGTLYALMGPIASAGFVSKISADGQMLEFSTYLRGHEGLAPYPDFLAEPSAMLTQNSISGIALDSSGNAIVVGNTRASDFPVVNPAQATNAGQSDAFAAIIAADGSAIRYATYFGGGGDDGALAAAIDPQGDVIFAGQTWSPDFPASGGIQPPSGYGDAFVVKLATAPVISAVLNGASLQPAIQAGSWVTIKGSNLAGTTDSANGSLPTVLDGASVTIDGNAALAGYVSPSQINVIASADSMIGPVNVVVTNNGAASAPATAQMVANAPAFFTDPATGYALTAGPAHPGSTVTLFAAGFTAPPTVTVGGIAEPVLSNSLAPGMNAVYAVTVQLPAGVPTGVALIVATVNGVASASGVKIAIGN